MRCNWLNITSEVVTTGCGNRLGVTVFWVTNQPGIQSQAVCKLSQERRQRGPNWQGMGGLGAGAAHNDVGRLDEDAQIEPEAPVLNVGGVEGNVLREGWIVARLHLPQAGEARQDFEAAEMLQFVFFYFGGDWGPRTDDAHLPAQHIQELRELVEAVFAEDSSEAGDARIVRNFEQDPVALVQSREVLLHVVRMIDHGAELEEGKDPAAFANAVGNVENRTVAFQLDRDRDGQHQRRGEDQREEGKHHIHDPLAE